MNRGTASDVNVQTRSGALSKLIVTLLTAVAMLLVVLGMHGTSVAFSGLSGERNNVSQSLPEIHTASGGHVSPGAVSARVVVAAAATVASVTSVIGGVVSGCAWCATDCAVVVMVCGVLLILAAIVLVGRSRSLSRWRRNPGLVLFSFGPTRHHTPRPSLTVLSISRT